MKKLLYAWIEQVLSFDTKEELEAYITKQKCLTKRRQQAQIMVISQEAVEGKHILRIRKPYNQNEMFGGQ